MSLTDEQIEHDKLLAAFEQNHQSFRSLNQQMWQIPLISMTLTGGLWFGVSKVEDFPVFQLALLALAGLGNAALFIVILRLRFVMGCHLTWLQENFEPGYVSAKGKEWYNKPFVVRTSFQFMLVLASIISLVLFIMTLNETDWHDVMPNNPALSYYEKHAVSLADGYETVSFETAHPELLKLLQDDLGGKELTILEVGAGTGRDAAWFAKQGHNVIAVEPSIAMQRIAKTLHPNLEIEWRVDALPNLATIKPSKQKYDLITLSAVWMHVPPNERLDALKTLIEFLEPDGHIYLTLRVGPEEPQRGIYSVSTDEVVEIASSLGMTAEKIDNQGDLLGRANIRWDYMLIKAP